MTLLEKLDKMATLMHFGGNRGYGWYARPIGAENVWGFGKTVEAACDDALRLPTDKHVPCIEAPVKRARATLVEAPVETRPRRRSLFDES